jgi:hypothetical protein
MMRSDAVRAVGGYDASTFGAEDYDLFLKLAERGGTLFNLSDVLLKYRQHFKSIGHAQKARQRQAAQAARRDAYRRRGMTSPTQREPAPPPEPSPAERHAMWAWWALMDRNVNCARIHAWHSLIRRPFAVHSWKLAACAARGF